DVIFDTVGKFPPSRSKILLKKEGISLSVKSSTKENAEDLYLLKDLIEAGVIRSVIDRRYPLEQITEAHRYVDKGHKKGNVDIIVERNTIT
ncbi:MAG: zinc-binding dehydrogenase, partial [Chloroflexota bacterium]